MKTLILLKLEPKLVNLIGKLECTLTKITQINEEISDLIYSEGNDDEINTHSDFYGNYMDYDLEIQMRIDKYKAILKIHDVKSSMTTPSIIPDKPDDTSKLRCQICRYA